MQTNPVKEGAPNHVAEFCTSLRRRPEWASVVPILLKAETTKWRESRINSHDLFIPLPHATDPDEDIFRFVLLSPSDVGKPETEQRLSRLHTLHSGLRVAVIFLLSTDGSNGMQSYQQLQLSMLSKYEMPLLPLTTRDDLPATIAAFQRSQQASSQPARGGSSSSSSNEGVVVPSAPRHLLPYCTITPPLSGQAVEVLGDVCHSLRDLVEMSSTQEGRATLTGVLGRAAADGAISFWLREYSLN